MTATVSLIFQVELWSFWLLLIHIIISIRNPHKFNCLASCSTYVHAVECMPCFCCGLCSLRVNFLPRQEWHMGGSTGRRLFSAKRRTIKTQTCRRNNQEEECRAAKAVEVAGRFSLKEFPVLEKEEVDGDFLKIVRRQSLPGGNQTL